MRSKPSRRRFRPLLALRRQPRLWWVVTLTLAVALGAGVASIVGQAEAARRSWGAGEAVVVVRRTVAAGEEIGPDDVALSQHPRALVPRGALHEVPVGQVARVVLHPGEVLLEARLAPLGAEGLAATLPVASRAVAIPVEPGQAPPVRVGDRVDVLVALAPEQAGDGPPGFVVAADALVVAVGDAAVTVAVDADAAPRIAVALGQGLVTLALVGV